MSKGRDRIIYKRPDDEKWVNKRIDVDRATSIHNTQKEQKKLQERI